MINTQKPWLLLLFMVGAFLCASQIAFGGCNVTPGYDPLDPDYTAPGTKWEGPITVFYYSGENVPFEVPCRNKTIEGEVAVTDKICCFLRLKQGSNVFSFARCYNGGDLSPSTFVGDAVSLVKTDFIPLTVIPAIYDCTPGSDCPPAVLKQYSLDVNGDDSLGTAGDNNFIYDWFILDVTIAVDE
ncbi:MAG: hypothetical protein JSW26_08425 [Desulfobacterales bacterium]|nr:MAG: hypothetical protein JSW26_08425 [Desulfobacterales bacterium]